MALSINQTIDYSSKIVGVSVNEQGINIDVVFTAPGQPPGQPRHFTLKIGDYAFRDPQGVVIYLDTSVLAPGILTDATNLFAKANSLYSQAVTDGLVTPC